MKVGINRKRIDLEVSDKTFSIGLVPIHVNYLVAQHDAQERNGSVDNDIESHNRQLEFMKECMKDLLESNGYVYDELWIISHLDLMGMQEFVVACLAKDIRDDVKKKLASAV